MPTTSREEKNRTTAALLAAAMGTIAIGGKAARGGVCRRQRA
jgi:hypothetical protein